MIMTQIQGVANTIIRRARLQGSVTPRQVREELAGARLPGTLWKDVIALARPELAYRHGRYFHVSMLSQRIDQEERNHRAVRRAVFQIVRAHKAETTRTERRRRARVDFIQPVKVLTEDRREATLLCRDISVTGLRLIGTRSLLGKKVRVSIARGTEAEPYHFLVRIIWACSVADDMFENGGVFVQMVNGEEESLKVVACQ
jgi:hypothetical protein